MTNDPTSRGPNTVSRRTVLRSGVIGGATVLVWATPSVTTWKPSAAHAQSPVPGDSAPGRGVAAQGDSPPPSQLATTGASGVLPLAAAGGAAVVTGGVAINRARAATHRTEAGPYDTTTGG